MGRLRGFLWLAAGLVIAVIAGFVAFITLSQAEARAVGDETQQAPTVSVVAAVGEVSVRSELTAEDLVKKDVPVDAAPEGAVSEIDDAAGKVTMVDLYPGEVVLAQRLVDPDVTSADGRKALILAEDEVMMAFPADDLMSRVGMLKPGDHVDLLFSLDFPSPGGGEEGGDSNLVTFNLLQNQTISAVVGAQTAEDGTASGGPQALLLNVDPQDALILKQVKDAGGTVDIVLRAPGAEQPFEIEPVDVEYLINRYQIPR